MATDPLKQGALTENSVGLGTVTLDTVHARALELAMIDGRPTKVLSETDLAQARRELTGRADIDPNDASLEAAPEAERWDPVAGSVGHKVATTSNEDEDDEGRSDSERLVEEGVSEAEHDQMLQAAKAERLADGG